MSCQTKEIMEVQYEYSTSTSTLRTCRAVQPMECSTVQFSTTKYTTGQDFAVPGHRKIMFVIYSVTTVVYKTFP